MPTRDNNRENKLPVEVVEIIAGAPDAHTAAGMYAGLTKLYEMIDDMDTRLVASSIGPWITFHFGEDMKEDERWGSIIRWLQHLPEPNRTQCIAYLETERYTPLRDRYRPFASFRRDKWYQPVWNGVDDFDFIRVK